MTDPRNAQDGDRDRPANPNGAASALREYAPEEIVDEILLSMVDGVGPLTAERLVTYFGDPTAVLNASAAELSRVEKVGPGLAQRIVEARRTYDPFALVRFCNDNAISVLTLNDARYPARLKQVDNPPRILYVRGTLLPQDYWSIAIVGTRHATEYGRRQASRLAAELVDAGFTIVSGLALGVDGCAHRSAMDRRGRTIAVLGGGVARIFPREHTDLAGRIVSGNGALISEYHPLTQPLRGNFPARNRIISGLSLGVLVVETGLRGGSLITARYAAEHNRELFAVPGQVEQEMARGCHQLLREGATLVETVDDILDALPAFEKPAPRREPEPRVEREYYVDPLGIDPASLASIDTRSNKDEEELDKKKKKRERSRADDPEERATKERREEKAADEPAPLPEGLNELERAVVEAVGAARVSIDELIRATGQPASRVLGTVAVLEFKQVLRRLEGNTVERRRV